MAVSWSKQKNVSEVAAKLRTDLGLGTAALADADDFYTKGEVDGYRTTDQNAAKDASNLTTGTVPDARLPDRLSYAPELDGITLTDFNDATSCGWYKGPDDAPNKPAYGWWVVLTSAVNPNYLRQDAYCWINGHHYRRYRDSGIWFGWERVYATAAEIQSLFPSRTSPEITMVSGGHFTFTHNLGVVPRQCDVLLVCKEDDNTYLVGDVVPLNPSFYYDGGTNGIGVTMRANTVEGRVGTGGIALVNLWDGRYKFYITYSKWRLIVRVSL